MLSVSGSKGKGCDNDMPVHSSYSKLNNSYRAREITSRIDTEHGNNPCVKAAPTIHAIHIEPWSIHRIPWLYKKRHTFEKIASSRY